MKLFATLAFLFCFTIVLHAQTKPVQGIVIDKETKQRLAKVYIYNVRSKEGLYNNTKGEFSTYANPGDTLVAALSGYGVDTIIFKGQTAAYFQLKSLGIRLRDVVIAQKRLTPQQQYEKSIKEFRYQTMKGSSKDLLNLGTGGVGLGIDAIYNLLSRQGRNARHLQKILEKDYREDLIDYRFKASLVQQVLGIKDTELEEFMQQYRPTYQFVLDADDYAFNIFIRNAYRSYRMNPKALQLPPLPKLTIEKL
ncbi:hypothetical protein ASE92_12160 [Pedobacter sp. Leaf41]|jgi:hypothetical protein|uniref:hypothetical protein n=1 Tax=Pedobacter sp. Leaf41 TaxID=1736218 RepID=UPI000702A8A9|nr:hypothetical protein [Pedobacter sp. Leaf41]KQN34354.1 hypothetical protein ASE92_12160 [Pedobacter sp. Leaf41]RZK65216.1 MAG: hypothetical protein EOO95_09020 [Pedobacter sp.]